MSIITHFGLNLAKKKHLSKMHRNNLAEISQRKPFDPMKTIPRVKKSSPLAKIHGHSVRNSEHEIGLRNGYYHARSVRNSKLRLNWKLVKTAEHFFSLYPEEIALKETELAIVRQK